MILFLPNKLRVQAYDSASPSRYAEADVRISVRRNTNPPIFSTQQYGANIDERAVIGTSVLTVVASDRDGVSLSTSNEDLFDVFVISVFWHFILWLYNFSKVLCYVDF